MLVRDEFPGKRMVNAMIDLPFALPTIVAGVVLLALYGKGSPVGIDITFTRAAVGLALLFVTLPFVVRSVQPVLLELDRSMEEAAASLGAGPATVLRRIVLPTLAPAIISGVALSFARAVGEFGSLVLITGNLPFKTEVGSVYIFSQIQNENLPAAAAVSVVLLLCALLVLAALTLFSRTAESLCHDPSSGSAHAGVYVLGPGLSATEGPPRPAPGGGRGRRAARAWACARSRSATWRRCCWRRWR